MTAPVRASKQGPTELGPRSLISLRVPDPVYNEVRERAALEGQSITQYVADILAACVGLPEWSHTEVYARARKERLALLKSQ